MEIQQQRENKKREKGKGGRKEENKAKEGNTNF